MMGRVVSFLKDYGEVASKMRLSVSSAALCYYFTMTFFPLIICLYALLGSNFDAAIRIMRSAKSVFAPETMKLMEDFLNYVAADSNPTMLMAALAVLVSVASAAIRSIQTTIGNAQGGLRLSGAAYFLFSLASSLAFLAAIYFAMIVMLTGKEFIALLNRFLPFVDMGYAWQYLRYPLLCCIYLLIVLGIYNIPRINAAHYNTFPGAAICTAGLFINSIVFSHFIAGSIRYPLVYGSLASIILLMIWLYSCCMIFYIGAAVNITLKGCSPDKSQREPCGN